MYIAQWSVGEPLSAPAACDTYRTILSSAAASASTRLLTPVANVALSNYYTAHVLVMFSYLVQ